MFCSRFETQFGISESRYHFELIISSQFYYWRSIGSNWLVF